MNKRQLLHSFLAASALSFGLVTAHAQGPVPIKFQLDWRFEGPAALFLHPAAKGYFKDAGLDEPSAVLDTGRKFRSTVLSLGGSRHPMEVFKEFRGREPSTRPLLEQTGLI